MTSLSRRRFVQSASTASLAVAATGLSGLARAQSPIALRLSSAHLPDLNSSHFAWEQLMQANLKKAVGDKIRIDYFPNNQLGSDTDMLSQIRSGGVEFFTLSGLILATLVPAASINGIGFAFPDYDTVWKAMDGDLGAHIRADDS